MENKKSLFRPNNYLNNCNLFALILFCILFTSCNNLPSDLQSRKDACITKLNDLLGREKNASGSDYNQLMHEYSELRDEVISYTADCNERGIRKVNDKLVSELNEKISKYKNLINSDNTHNTSICNICGKSFTGSGYEEVSTGIWKVCEYPYQSFICSPSCGEKATSRIKGAINNLVNSLGSNRCSNCGSGNYINGFCNICGAASPAKMTQSRSQLQDCPLCHGTGIEMPAGANQLNETGRICPVCSGTGKQSY